MLERTSSREEPEQTVSVRRLLKVAFMFWRAWSTFSNLGRNIVRTSGTNRGIGHFLFTIQDFHCYKVVQPTSKLRLIPIHLN